MVATKKLSYSIPISFKIYDEKLYDKLANQIQHF